MCVARHVTSGNCVSQANQGGDNLDGSAAGVVSNEDTQVLCVG